MKQTLQQDHRRQGATSAFTLLELLTVVTIIAVLASVVFALSSSIRKKAERVACGENLKTLHMALSTYLVDNKRWPQISTDSIQDEEEYWQAWVRALEPYKLPDKVWMCPTYKRATREELLRFSSYHPFPFDGKSIHTPYRWSNMPWVAEIGDNHGDGALLIMPDGSIQTAEYNIETPFTTLPKR